MIPVRTTLEIEDDVLLAAKELARRGGTTAGRVVSNLLRQALTQPVTETARSAKEPAAVYGFRPFPKRGRVVTNEQVDKLRDEEGV
jgi:predicted transcriptional regulator